MISKNCATLFFFPLFFFLSLAGVAAPQSLYAAGGGTKIMPEEELQLHIVIKAASYVGIAYRFGGNDARGVDCSGFIAGLLYEVIPSIPRQVKDLYTFGSPLKREDLEPGDLVFFNTTGPGPSPSHVGLYIGDDHFIHAASEGDRTGVIISSLDKRYYASRYAGARRVLHLAADH